MFKIVSTAAIVALVATSAMAKAPAYKILAGQYTATTQYTALDDTSSLCTSVAGLAAGQVTTAVATFTALGDTWTETIANTNGPGYGVSWVNCQFPALPLASQWIASTTTPYIYTATPAGANVASCVSPTSPYTLTSNNDTITVGTGSLKQTLVYTSLPTNAATGYKASDSGFKITTTNSALTIPGVGVACYLSIDSLFLATQK